MLILLGVLMLGGDILEVERAVTAPGGRVAARVFLTHGGHISGYEVRVLYDSDLLTFTGGTIEGLDVEGLGPPEYFQVQVETSSAGRGLASIGVVFDLTEPFNDRKFPAGERHSIARFEFVSSRDPSLIGSCTALEPLSPESWPSLVVVDGAVCFEDRPLFRRGDGNGDGVLDLSDPVLVLGWLFLGGPEPGCRDAADANDDGRVDIADPLLALGALFLRVGKIPDPFPACGVDPPGLSAGCRDSPACP